MNEDINVNVKTLRPLTKLIYTIGELPSSYLMSMTYEEQLVWFCNYLATQVIPTVNNNGEAVSELQNLYIELQNYVNEYFDNLDLQEEVSIKVDELVENGTITSLIETYMTPYITEQDNKIATIETKVNSVASGAPIAVTDVSEMTDTDRVYVNTTDGKWYYYDGDSWEIGGTYQATQVGENSVNLNAFTNDLKETLKLSEYFESKGFLQYGSFGAYSITNNKIVLGNTTNHTRIRGIKIPIKNGDKITFNNPDSIYKCAYTFTDSEENVLLHKSLGDYSTATYDNYLVNIANVKYFNCMVAYDDNSEITDTRGLFGLISITSHTIDDTIINDSIEYTKIKNAVKSNNLISLDFVPFGYGDTNKALIKYTNTTGAIPQALIMEIDKNTTYYIKTYDEHNRFRIIALDEYPEFNILDYGTNQIAYFISDENLIVQNDSLNEYTFDNTHFKYLILILNTSTNPTYPRVTISKIELENYEEFKMSLPNLKYKVPSELTRSVYFTETTYATDCEMQGCCTDGTYLYYGMHDLNDTDNGVIGKIDLSNGNLVSEVKNHPYGHVNGMCYYNNRIYIASASETTNTESTIYTLNTGDLSYESSFDLESKIKTFWEAYSYGDYKGIGAIGHSDELNKFVCLIRKNTTGKQFRGFAIFDNSFNLEKLIKINPDNVPTTETTTVGGMDCDDKYIYLTMVKSTYDIIQIYDYNGNLIKEITLPASPRDYIEGITVIDNVLYTSNASDKICKYKINRKEDISMGDVLDQYNFN